MPHPPPIPNNPPCPANGIALPGKASRPVPPPRPVSTGPTNTSNVESKSSRWSVITKDTSIRNTSSFLTSLVVHCALFIVLALIVPATHESNQGLALVVDMDGTQATAAEPDDLPISIDPAQWDASPLSSLPAGDSELTDSIEVASPFAVPTTPPSLARPADETRILSAEHLLVPSNYILGGGIEGRAPQQRARLAGERGGTPGSENAVELALTWLAEHQRPDGSWCLNLNDGPCQGRCPNPGLTESNTGATALALLPFLGAGYSHQEGPYQEVVRKGLYFLTTRMRETDYGGDLTENVTMYAHGLASIALCEGLVMTGDPNLGPPAQKAIDFICYAQHPGGGWRYFPGQPGDTTVTGWQVMALKSGRLAKLQVSSQTTQRVRDFLDSVQDGGGAFYGYQKPDKQPGSTAVGLLLRMYSGWERDDPRLAKGVTYLAHLGPSKTDVYFDYYATQVVNHYGGSTWEQWNTRMREHLVATQAKKGHERGSWFFPDKHGSVGGRLYTTAMCAMILEVYYRYLPLYGNEAIADTF